MRYTIIIGLVFLVVSDCERYSYSSEGQCDRVYKIAIMLPLSGPDQNDWEKSSNWILDNIEYSGCIADGKIELIWYDTFNKNNEANYIENIATEICENDDIIAAIGPFTSGQAFIAAPIFINHEKTLILPVASSEDISTAFSGKKFIWRLVEPDISQCQVQLIIAKSKGVKKIALITGDDPYGITFYNWFGFLATEMGLEVTAIEKFNQETDPCEPYMKTVLDSNPEMLIAIPRNVEQAVSMTEQWRNYESDTKILFSDGAFLNGFINLLGEEAEGIEGTTISSNPVSGFNIAYRDKFNNSPALGEAQLYDAILLLAYAIQVSGGNAGYELSSSMMKVVDGVDNETDWTRPGINQALEMLKHGKYPRIIGASADLKFAKDFYTDIICSSYLHWKVEGGEFREVKYYNSDRSYRITDLGAAWQIYGDPEIITDTLSINTIKNKDLQVLIMASSKGWSNYRHQADALKMYQILKKNGIDDDHIILIIEDDIANNTRNPLQGIILDALTGENLYKNVNIDYKTEDITSDIFLELLSDLTSKSEKAEETNILIYISGHGQNTGLIDEEGNLFITPDQLKNTINKMHLENKYLRLLCIIEACYSGVFETSCTADQSSLYLTASNSIEASKAANYNSEIGAWISSKFSYELYRQIENDTYMVFSDLYINLLKSVNGSHICIYPSANFGNIHKVSINEFLLPSGIN